MPHRNAPLTELGRLRLARCVVKEGWPLRRAAERFQVSPTTAARWARRYREHGPAGMADRSGRPHHSPRRTPQRIERRILGLRVSGRMRPARIASRLGLHPSTSTGSPTSPPRATTSPRCLPAPGYGDRAVRGGMHGGAAVAGGSVRTRVQG